MYGLNSHNGILKDCSRHIIFTFSLIINILCYQSPVNAGFIHELIKIDEYEYKIYYNSKKYITKLNILEFHNNFSNCIPVLYNKYNVRLPGSFKINICENPSVYAAITGSNWYVAGEYSALFDEFFFQRPGSLKKRNILDKVIKHEITHQIINKQRKKKAEDIYWLEESFCESLYPIERQGELKLGILLKTIITYNDLKSYISKNIISRNREKRRKTYYISHVLGSFLIKRLGERSLFDIITLKKDIIPVKRECEYFLKLYRK